MRRGISCLIKIEKVNLKVRCTGDGVKYRICDQAVHPSIIFDQKKHLYIVALTPYPYGDSKFENPSIVFSKDLKTLEDFKLNPLLPPPPGSRNGNYFADPEIFYFDNKINLFIGILSKTLKMNGYLYFALDSKGRKITEPLFIDIPFTTNVSITTVCTHEICQYWTVNPRKRPFEITRYKTTRDTFPYPVDKTTVKYRITYKKEWNIWHLSVRKTNKGKFLMLAAANPLGNKNGNPPMHLFLLESTDGIEFEETNNLLLMLNWFQKLNIYIGVTLSY